MKNRVLFFKNISELKEEKKQTPAFSLAAFYLASAITNIDDFQVTFSDYSLANDDNVWAEKNKQLILFLQNNQDMNFICLTLIEGYFDKFQELLRLIRQYSKAYILVGGLMPTLSPEQVFYNLPEIDMLVRGEGEDILAVVLNLLKDKNVESNLGTDILAKLSKQDGLIFRHHGQVYQGDLEKINFNKNFKLQHLDFDLFASRDFSDGLKLYSSRGCLNHCSFCTSFLHRNYYSFSLDDLIAALEKYAQKLIVWFGDISNVPRDYFRISFYDDDFLVDRKRAIGFFDYIRRHPYFAIGFFQTGIKSFYIYEGNKCTDKFDLELLDSLNQDLFKRERLATDDHFIYIGTENFSDKELEYLGKGYLYSKIEKIINELAKRRIFQAHHFIFSNMETSLNDLQLNFSRIAYLRKKYFPYFNILLPLIPNLVSYFPSNNFNKIINLGDSEFLKVRKSVAGQYPYQFIERDLCKNKLVDRLSAVINKFITEQKRINPIFLNKLVGVIKNEKRDVARK